MSSTAETLGWAAEQKPETIRQPRGSAPSATGAAAASRGTKRLRQRLRRHFKQHWRSRPGRSSSVNATLTGRCSKIAAYPVGSQCTVLLYRCNSFFWHGWSWIEIVASLHFFLHLFLTCRSMNNLISKIYFVKNRYLIIISKNHDQVSGLFYKLFYTPNWKSLECWTKFIYDTNTIWNQHFLCEKR